MLEDRRREPSAPAVRVLAAAGTLTAWFATAGLCSAQTDAGPPELDAGAQSTDAGVPAEAPPMLPSAECRSPAEPPPCGEASELQACASTRATADLSFELDRDATVYLARSDRTVFDHGGQVVRFRWRAAQPDDAAPYVVVERLVPDEDGRARVELLAHGQINDELIYEIPAATADGAVLRVRTFSGVGSSERPSEALGAQLEEFRRSVCEERLPALRRRLGDTPLIRELAASCAAPAAECPAGDVATLATTGTTDIGTRDVEGRARAMLVTIDYARRLSACPGSARIGVPLGTAEIPLTTGRVALAHWGAGAVSVHTRAGEGVQVLLVDVPRATRVHAARTSQPQDRTTPLELLSQFARLVAGGVMEIAGAAGAREVACYLPDASIPTLNPLTSRVYDATAGDGENRTVQFCTQMGCRSETERNRITVVPSAGSGLTLMLDVQWMMPHDLTRGEDGYGYDEYVAVSGPFGADQPFERRDQFDARQYFVTSVLIGWRFADVFGSRDAFLGVGPTLVDLRGERAFRDAHLRFSVETFDFVHVSVGFSLGAVERRAPVGYPGMINVPRATPGLTPDAPNPPRDTSVIFAFGIGVSVDLGVTGVAVEEVVDALDNGD